MTYKVFVTREIPKKGLSLLKERYEVDVWPEDHPPSRTDLLSKLKEVDGLLSLLTEPIDEEILNAGVKLQIICQMAVGYDNIDVTNATRHGIYVTNTPGVLTETTADFAFALLMTTARRISEADNWVRNGQWNIPWGPMMFLGGDISGKTLGIIGLGRIGSGMAHRAKGFGMKLMYYDVSRNPKLEQQYGLQFMEYEQLLQEADFISLHVPLTPETRGLVNSKALSLMKKTAYLINTSRGPVIDEKALYHALKSGQIAGSGLDVFIEEPISQDSPLLTLPNIVITPHIASASIETRGKMAEMAAMNMVEFFEGRTPPNLVNPEVLNIKPME